MGGGVRSRAGRARDYGVGLPPLHTVLPYVLRGRPSELPAWVVVSAAGLGGLMYWVAIFPVDQIKSAMQTDAIDPAQRRFPNMAVATQVRSALCCSAPRYF